MENNLAKKIFNQITFIARKHSNKEIENFNEFEIDKLRYANAIKSKETKECVFWSVTHIPSKAMISIGLAFSFKNHTINTAVAVAKCQLMKAKHNLHFIKINNAVQVEFSINSNDFLNKRLEIYQTTLLFFSILKKQNIAQISENKRILRPSPICRIPKTIYLRK
jgi:hypothetical protein